MTLFAIWSHDKKQPHAKHVTVTTIAVSCFINTATTTIVKMTNKKNSTMVECNRLPLTSSKHLSQAQAPSSLQSIPFAPVAIPSSLFQTDNKSNLEGSTAIDLINEALATLEVDENDLKAFSTSIKSQ